MAEAVAKQQPIDRVREELRKVGRKIAVFDGPNTLSDFEIWNTARGLALVQCWRDGGVEVFVPIDPSGSLATEPTLEAIRRLA